MHDTPPRLVHTQPDGPTPDLVPGHPSIVVALARLAPAAWAWDPHRAVLLIDAGTDVIEQVASALRTLFPHLERQRGTDPGAEAGDG